jgi:hypothetical protein
VSEDGLKIKKKDPVPGDLSFEGRVLVLKRFPESLENNITVENIQALFPEYKLLSVRVFREKKNRMALLFGCFVCLLLVFVFVCFVCLFCSFVCLC